MSVSTATRYLCRECGQPLPWEGSHACGDVPYTDHARLILALDAGAETAAEVAAALGCTTRTAYTWLADLVAEGLAEECEPRRRHWWPPAKCWRLK